MSKVRVHEYAKKVNKTSKEVIDQLAKFDVVVTNHMSTIETVAVTKLDSVFKQESEPKKATPTKAPAGEKKQASPQNQVKQGGQPKSAPTQAKQGNQQVKKQEGRPQSETTQHQQPRKANNAPSQQQQQQQSSKSEKQQNVKGNQNRNMTQNTNNNSNSNKSNTSGGNTFRNANATPANSRNNNNKGGYQQRKKPGINGGKRRQNRPNPVLQQQAPKELPEKITFYESLSVAELAKKLHREPSEIKNFGIKSYVTHFHCKLFKSIQPSTNRT